ncbi:MAG: hypothetical protein HY748_11460 [Elusimicrobia bacterium]|nr:hypothetical protein [Elusimicrobiota bacterium]
MLARPPSRGTVSLPCRVHPSWLGMDTGTSEAVRGASARTREGLDIDDRIAAASSAAVSNPERLSSQRDSGTRSSSPLAVRGHANDQAINAARQAEVGWAMG